MIVLIVKFLCVQTQRMTGVYILVYSVYFLWQIVVIMLSWMLENQNEYE